MLMSPSASGSEAYGNANGNVGCCQRNVACTLLDLRFQKLFLRCHPAVHHRQPGHRLYLLDHSQESAAGDADVVLLHHFLELNNCLLQWDLLASRCGRVDVEGLVRAN